MPDIELAFRSAGFAAIPDLLPFVVTFNLKDFIEASQRLPNSPTNVNESCLRVALTDVLPWANDQASCDQCHFFFDQGEPFYGHLVQLLQSKRAVKDAHFLRKITHCGESNSRLVPALQLADLYAWCQSHRNSSWQPQWQTKLLKTHFRWKWLDKPDLTNVDHADQERFLSWNLPKRAPTK